jgi:NAD(P)H-hydrate epimerase
MTWPLPETVDGALDGSAFDMITALQAGKGCLALGPGIGTSDETRDLVLRVLGQSPVPVVIDADGLNCLGRNPGFLKDLDVPVILTPHPGEMARLTGKSTGEIQSNRVGAAGKFAASFGVHLVLKGARTVIAHPDGRICINPTGNPGMASGGMGDVLTGVIAGLATQGFSPDTAAQAGVYLHGLAADAAAGEIGPFGYLATDVIERLPVQIRQLTEPITPPRCSWPVASVPGLSPAPVTLNGR